MTADGSDVLVLGCAGMTDFAEWLGDELGVPVVDGVAAATATVVGLVAMGLGTSKAGEFAAPRAKRGERLVGRRRPQAACALSAATVSSVQVSQNPPTASSTCAKESAAKSRSW
ncbi:MAG: aspartate/glutamate racemase family protein [Aeromicrobium erythreum]